MTETFVTLTDIVALLVILGAVFGGILTLYYQWRKRK